MNKRIEELAKLTLGGKMYAYPVKTEFDREELLLPRQQMESKRLCEYILNQQPVLTQYSKMTGFFNCDGSVVGDAFRRKGHKYFEAIKSEFYLKPIDNLSTLEWQHATADYNKLLEKGISGIIEEIDESLKAHGCGEEREFLLALKRVAETLIKWAHKCSDKALELSKTVSEPEYAANLKELAAALRYVPENKPRSFYEAVLSVYLCFSADPDSIGTPDRYLRPFYENDIKNGVITREQAKEYLQELFLMLQAATRPDSATFTRGGESHFCIGGYLPDGSDGFCDLSRLILEGLMELPSFIPQVSLRWTAKTPREAFRFALDCERNDPNKRVAFQNDDKRIKCYTEICGFPFEKAVGYTTVGCNEPAFPGGVSGGNSKINILRSTDILFHRKSEKIADAKTYEEFRKVFLDEMFSDMDTALDYDDAYNRVRADDVNYLSSIFFHGCIEKARSLTRGTGEYVIASPEYIGITNVIDSMIIVKQFVFDEKITTMHKLIAAVQGNWKGYEDLHTLIVNKGDFFGNDTERSNAVAQDFYHSVYLHLKDKTNLFGYHCLVGDLIGYNEHHKWFGEHTKATPDGRSDGEMLKFGLGQRGGSDRNGLSALLNSIAKADPDGIGCGDTVTNLTIDEQLVKNDANFDKTVDMLETYFKNGGVHFQLNYVSREELICAKAAPDDYKSLRVRVSGFSDYFVKLKDSLQDEIIDRTSQQ